MKNLTTAELAGLATAIVQSESDQCMSRGIHKKSKKNLKKSPKYLVQFHPLAVGEESEIGHHRREASDLQPPLSLHFLVRFHRQ